MQCKASCFGEWAPPFINGDIGHFAVKYLLDFRPALVVFVASLEATTGVGRVNFLVALVQVQVRFTVRTDFPNRSHFKFKLGR